MTQETDDNDTICGNCDEKYESVRDNDTTGLCGICDLIRQSEERPEDEYKDDENDLGHDQDRAYDRYVDLQFE